MSDLYPEYRLGDLTLTDYPYSVRFGGDLGAPETVTDILVSLIGDGEIETRRRYGNREITLTVGIEGLKC